MTYLPFVDGLRAVAIAAVVAFHAFPEFLSGGFAGVDVFFVISGFLITRFIAAEMAAGMFSISRFYVRRARRLLPAALVCFTIVATLSAFVLLPDAYWYFGRSLLSAVLMYANIFFYNTGGYFSAPSLEKPLLHTWSLAVEDQFYLTWPLMLLALLPRRGVKAIVGVGIALLVASLAYAEFKLVSDPEFSFFQLPTRAWELLTGALLALSAPAIVFSKREAEGLAVLGAAAVLSSFVFLLPEARFPGLGALPACLGTAAIISASLAHSTCVSRLLSLRPVVFGGLISYSLYLWHWPLNALASYRLERPLDTFEASVVVALSIGVAILSWRFVERPFRVPHNGASSTRSFDRHFVLGALGSVATVAAFAGVLKVWKGVPERYEPEVRTILEQLGSGNPLRGSCDNLDKIFENDGVCNFGRQKSASGSYDVALFGDSMADHWVPAVAKYAESNDLSGRQVTNGGCAFLSGAAGLARPASKARECTAYLSAAERFITTNPGLKVAIISAYWEKWLRRFEEPAMSGGTRNEEILPPFLRNDAPVFERALSETLQRFTDRGIKVVLIGQIPTYPAVPLRCIVTAVREHRSAEECGMTTLEMTAELGPSNRALQRVAAANPKVFVSLPSDTMCKGGRCRPYLDGVLLYKNGKHVNRFGAMHLAPSIRFPELE